MRKYLYRVVILTMLFQTFSCSDTWLEPDPLSFYSPENTFTNAEGMYGALYACLRNQRHEYYNDGSPLITENLFSEGFVEGTTDKSGPAMNMNIQIQPSANLNSTNYNKIGWYWLEGFKKVKYASVVISRIDAATYESAEERNSVLGTALFHRAIAYYRLVNQFGDVPFIAEEIASPRLDFNTHSRASILSQIELDLKFGAKWIPWDQPVGQINKAAAKHLLAKVLIQNGKFDEAIQQTTDIIENSSYELMQAPFGQDIDDQTTNTIWSLHRENNKHITSNKEAIWVVMSSEDMSDGSDRVQVARNCIPFWGNNISSPAGTGTKATSDGTNDGLVHLYGRGIGRMRPTNYSQFDIWSEKDPEVDTDMRHHKDDNRNNWMKMEYLTYNNTGMLTKTEDAVWYQTPLQFSVDGTVLCKDTVRSWFEWPNYKTSIPDPTVTQPTGGRYPWYVFRLAETYLIRAEAYWWNNNTSLATADVNAVRARAGAPLATASEVDINYILDERARELYYEEWRKTELTRISYVFATTGASNPSNGKSYSMANFSSDNFWYDRVIKYNNYYREEVPTTYNGVYSMSAYHIMWPVPEDAINANTQGVINQNPGYAGGGETNNITPIEWEVTAPIEM